MTSDTKHKKSRILIAKILFIVLVASAVMAICFVRNSIPIAYRPVMLGLACTLFLSLLVWPLTAWARLGWSPVPPEGLEGLMGGYDRPGSHMIGVFEAVVFYAAFVSAAWAVVGGWLVFKAASKWAAWQHIMKVPDNWGDADKGEYFVFRRDWSSSLLTSFLFGTLANVTVAFAGTALANMLLQPTACCGG